MKKTINCIINETTLNKQEITVKQILIPLPTRDIISSEYPKWIAQKIVISDKLVGLGFEAEDYKARNLKRFDFSR